MIYSGGTNMTSLSYDSSTSSWKSWRWTKLDLTFTMKNIYINCNLEWASNYNPVTNFGNCRINTQFSRYHPKEHFYRRTSPISMRKEHSLLNLEESQWNWRRSKKYKNVQKSRTLRITVRGASRRMQAGKWTIWVTLFKTKKSKSIHQIY